MKLNMLEVRANLNKHNKPAKHFLCHPSKHSPFVNLRILLYHKSCIASSQQTALHQHHTTPTKSYNSSCVSHKILDNFNIKMAINYPMLLISFILLLLITNFISQFSYILNPIDNIGLEKSKNLTISTKMVAFF